MNKSDLLLSIAKKYPSLDHTDVKKIVDIIFAEMTNSLKKGNRIEIRGFGSFSIRTRNSKTTRNPKTNEVIPLENKNVVYFRGGKDLFNKLNSESKIETSN